MSMERNQAMEILKDKTIQVTTDWATLYIRPKDVCLKNRMAWITGGKDEVLTMRQRSFDNMIQNNFCTDRHATYTLCELNQDKAV